VCFGVGAATGFKFFNSKGVEHVFGGDPGDFFKGCVSDPGNFQGRITDEGRFVFFTPMGRRGEVGGICLEEDLIQGGFLGNFSQIMGTAVGHRSGYGEKKPPVQILSGQIPVAGKTVKDATGQACTEFEKNVVDFLMGLSIMDDDGKPQG